VKKTRKVAPKGPQPTRLESVTTTINGANRTLTVGREVSLHKTRLSLKGGRHRLTGIERKPDGRLELIVFGPLSSVRPKQHYIGPDDIKAIHHKPQKARALRLTPLEQELAKSCENCLAIDCPGAVGKECRERD